MTRPVIDYYMMGVTMGRIVRGICAAMAATAISFVVGSAQPAWAACHSFTVSADPEEVAEGGTVTVTVSRDAGVAPSSVDVEAVSETATSGEDFEAFSQTVSFSTETSQSFSLATTDDVAVEGNETFRLRLSNPQGCAVNPRLVVGPDATVTIIDNDTAATTTAAPAPTSTTAAPTTTATTGTSTSTTASTSTSTTEVGTTSSTSTTVEVDVDDEEAAPIAEDDDGGGNGGAVLLLLLAIAVVGGAIGYLVWRRAGRPSGA